MSVPTKRSLTSDKPVVTACVNCRTSKLRCSQQRPCERCVLSGKEDTCVDYQPKARGRKSARHNPTGPSHTANQSASRSSRRPPRPRDPLPVQAAPTTRLRRRTMGEETPQYDESDNHDHYHSDDSLNEEDDSDGEHPHHHHPNHFADDGGETVCLNQNFNDDMDGYNTRATRSRARSGTQSASRGGNRSLPAHNNTKNVGTVNFEPKVEPKLSQPQYSQLPQPPAQQTILMSMSKGPLTQQHQTNPTGTSTFHPTPLHLTTATPPANNMTSLCPYTYAQNTHTTHHDPQTQSLGNANTPTSLLFSLSIEATPAQLNLSAIAQAVNVPGGQSSVSQPSNPGQNTGLFSAQFPMYQIPPYPIPPHTNATSLGGGVANCNSNTSQNTIFSTNPHPVNPSSTTPNPSNPAKGNIYLQQNQQQPHAPHNHAAFPHYSTTTPPSTTNPTKSPYFLSIVQQHSHLTAPHVPNSISPLSGPAERHNSTIITPPAHKGYIASSHIKATTPTNTQATLTRSHTPTQVVQPINAFMITNTNNNPNNHANPGQNSGVLAQTGASVTGKTISTPVMLANMHHNRENAFTPTTSLANLTISTTPTHQHSAISAGNIQSPAPHNMASQLLQLQQNPLKHSHINTTFQNLASNSGINKALVKKGPVTTPSQLFGANVPHNGPGINISTNVPDPTSTLGVNPQRDRDNAVNTKLSSLFSSINPGNQSLSGQSMAGLNINVIGPPNPSHLAKPTSSLAPGLSLLRGGEKNEKPYNSTQSQNNPSLSLGGLSLNTNMAFGGPHMAVPGSAIVFSHQGTSTGSSTLSTGNTSGIFGGSANSSAGQNTPGGGHFDGENNVSSYHHPTVGTATPNSAVIFGTSDSSKKTTLQVAQIPHPPQHTSIFYQNMIKTHQTNTNVATLNTLDNSKPKVGQNPPIASSSIFRASPTPQTPGSTATPIPLSITHSTASSTLSTTRMTLHTDHQPQVGLSSMNFNPGIIPMAAGSTYHGSNGDPDLNYMSDYSVLLGESGQKDNSDALGTIAGLTFDVSAIVGANGTQQNGDNNFMLDTRDDEKISSSGSLFSPSLV